MKVQLFNVKAKQLLSELKRPAEKIFPGNIWCNNVQSGEDKLSEGVKRFVNGVNSDALKESASKTVALVEPLLQLQVQSLFPPNLVGRLGLHQ